MKQRRQRMIIKAFMLSKEGTLFILKSTLFTSPYPIIASCGCGWTVYKEYRNFHESKGVDLRVEQRSIF